MKKSDKIIYWVTTGLFSALMMMSAMMYLFNNPMAVEAFEKLGFPVYIIYPLAAAKILGVVAIWSNFSDRLKDWAYAGFTFNLLLAASAHMNIGDGEFAPAIVALVILGVSYYFNRKIQASKS